MHAVTEQVVQRALDDAAVWHARGHRIPVAVNLFPPTLADLDLPVRLEHALEGHGLTSSALAVEITEDFMLGDLDRARIVLTGLHRPGISIAIDDFCSGYSSLYYLHELPIDEVKLDRSLIASIAEDPRAATIARSVIDLLHTPGLTTVAEGVETPAPPPSSPAMDATSPRATTSAVPSPPRSSSTWSLNTPRHNRPQFVEMRSRIAVIDQPVANGSEQDEPVATLKVVAATVSPQRVAMRVRTGRPAPTTLGSAGDTWGL